MRASISARVFLGYAAVLVTFGLVAVFGVVQLHRIGEGLQLVSQAYHPLTRLGAQLESSYRNSEQATARLLDEKDARTRGALLYLAVDYHPRAAREKVRAAQQVIERARVGTPASERSLVDWALRRPGTRAGAPASERPFLDRLDGLLASVVVRYDEYARIGAEVSAIVARMQKGEGDAAIVAELDAAARRLKRVEKSIGVALADFGAEVEERIDLRVREAGREERRSTVLVATFALLAFGIGVFVTVLSQRALAPMGRLTDAVRELGEGRFEGELPVRGDDEVGLLAREFNKMVQRLAERDRQLQEKSAEVLRAERLATVGRLAAQITHEIRNPLSSLSLNAELLQESLAEEAPDETSRAEASAIVRSMAREVDRLTEVTEQYLRFARLPRPSPESVDLDDEVDDLLAFMSAELANHGVRVVHAPGADVPPVQADPGQLRQVLLNLVRNAREAVGRGGTVTVRTGTSLDGQRVVLEVVDDGPGIPEDVRVRIFEPFYSTKERGTGLGLSLVQQIVHEHGGELACESTPGTGTRMIVTLPAASEEASDLDAVAVREVV